MENERKYPWLTASTENDVLLQQRLVDLLGPLTHSGSIKFFNKGKEVGSIALPERSTMEARHVLAELAQVREYDNFHLVRLNGDVVDASTVFMNGLMTVQEDIHINLGLHEGIKYQFYKNKDVCSHCGGVKYLAKYPEQKYLVEQLYQKPKNEHSN